MVERIRITEDHIANLKKLADFLVTSVPPPQFHMGDFMRVINKEILDTNYFKESPIYIKLKNELETNSLDPNDIYHEGIVVYIEEAAQYYNQCGTVACALGHGPLAGIEPEDGENWSEYCERAFGVGRFSNEFEWLFGSSWRKVDNTPQGAAARIYVYIENGIPDNWEEQMAGLELLSYTAQPYTPVKCELPVK